MTKNLSVIVLSYNTKDLLLDCVRSIQKNTKGIDYEIIVVDNASIDGSAQAVAKLKVKLIRNKENLGFTGGNNQGIKIASGEFVLLLNSDTLISDNVLSDMVNWMKAHPDVGVATCSLRNRDGSLQGTGGYFPTLVRVFSWMTIQDFPFVDFIIKPFQPMKEKSFSRNISFYTKERDVDWVTGAFLMTRRKVIEGIGGLDEDFFMYGEDVDFCFRAKEKGWRVKYLPQFSITHFGGASSVREFPFIQEYKSMKIFYKKHYPGWQYPILRFFLKIGALGRIIVLGLLRGKEYAKIYAKAYSVA